MERWLRRLRGIVGTRALWGAAFMAIGTLAVPLVSVFGEFPVFESLLRLGLGGGVAGFLLGSGFPSVLTTIDGRSTFDELTPERAAVSGAMAGAAYPLAVLLVYFGMGGPVPPLRENLVVVLLATCGFYELLSAGLGAATLSLARKAPAETSPGKAAELLGASSQGGQEHPITLGSRTGP